LTPPTLLEMGMFQQLTPTSPARVGDKRNDQL
jgi:hypothetical protein